MVILIILLLLLLLLLLIPVSYWLDEYLYGVFSAETQESAAVYYADSIAPTARVAYEGAFDGILPTGQLL